MRIRSIIIVLAVILGILTVAHAIIYEGIVIGFLVQNPVLLLCLKIIFAFLDVSFIAAAFLTFRFNNIFTRIFYRFSAAWLGFLLYMFMAAFVTIVFTALFFVSTTLASVLFILAIVVAIYGLIHASTIKIKNISVSFPNLPQSWLGRKAVFISDLHLGQVRGKNFADNIHRTIEELHPDIVFIGGDIYDGIKVNEKEIIEPLSNLKAPLGTYFVTGNHEEFSDNSLFLAAIRGVGIITLMDEKIEIQGVQIVGVDYRTTTKAEHFAKILQKMNIDRSKPAILLKHTPIHLDIAEEKGIDLGLFGHTHKAQVFPFNLLTPIIFKGFDYGYKRLKNMAVYTSSGVGTWGAPLRVGTDSEIILITITN